MKKLSLSAFKMSAKQTLSNNSMKTIVAGTDTALSILDCSYELFQETDPTGRAASYELFQEVDATGRAANYDLFQEVDATGRPIKKK